MHQFARSLLPRPVRHLLPRTGKRVLVIGGGPTGLFCADRLRHHFEVTLVDAKEYFEFTPSVLRAVVDPAHLSRITFNYREVLEHELGVQFVHGNASAVDVGASPSGAGRGTVDVATRTGQGKLHFDYCIIAVGVSNGVWKPRLLGEKYSGIGASTLSGAASLEELTLEGRRTTLRALRDRIASSRGVVVVGAGLVGVEMAAELVHFFPRLRVTLVDGAPDVLPQLGEGARQYARQWLQTHNVALKLNKPFAPEWVASDEVVLSCVGSRPRAGSMLSEPSALRSNGQIRVNRNMQVIHLPPDGADEAAMGTTSSVHEPVGAFSSVAGEPPDGSSLSDPFSEGRGGSSRKRPGFAPLGQGRIFAVGDTASVQDVPTGQIIYHGEEMAAVAVANIEALEGVMSPLNFMQAGRELEVNQPFLCCTSLGPLDGMFSTQAELISTGTLAALQKQMIEATKVAQLKGDLVCSALWYPVH